MRVSCCCDCSGSDSSLWQGLWISRGHSGYDEAVASQATVSGTLVLALITFNASSPLQRPIPSARQRLGAKHLTSLATPTN